MIFIGWDSKKFSKSNVLITTRRPTFCAFNCLLRISKRIVEQPSPACAAACFTVRKAFSVDAPSLASRSLTPIASRRLFDYRLQNRGQGFSQGVIRIVHRLEPSTPARLRFGRVFENL